MRLAPRVSQGLQGVKGETGAGGAPGATGAQGAAGVSGAIGSTGVIGATGTSGSQGLQGVKGETGAGGAPGARGPQGLKGAEGAGGATGSPAKLDRRGLPGLRVRKGLRAPTAPPGRADSRSMPTSTTKAKETVPLESAVTFDSNGVVTPGITHVAGTAGVTLATSGTYMVTFSVSGTQPSQMALFVNGTVVPGLVYGLGAGTQQNNGQAIVVISAGGVLTVRNRSSSVALVSRHRSEEHSRPQMLPLPSRSSRRSSDSYPSPQRHSK